MATEKQGKGNLVRLAAYSALVSRASLLNKLGYEYSGDRNLYEALGYKSELTYDDYVTQYDRQDMAKAVIDRPVDATWRGGFTIVESDDDEDTPLEKESKELCRRLKLLSRFAQLDRLTGLGEYAVLLMGFDDVDAAWNFDKPVKSGSRKLLYVRPFGQGHAQIIEYESDTSNERYGRPKTYSLTIVDNSGVSQSTLQVHHSRVIHVVDGLLESEIKGTPRLQAVFNRLKDIEKIAGGSSEMYWRGARPGYQGKVDPEYTLTQTMRDDLMDEMDEFEHNLRRILLLQGMSLSPLAPQVVDPAGHIDIQIQLISAEKSIPKRILTGSERGELASSEDKDSWFGTIAGRRDEFAEVNIVRPFFDMCIEYGTLSKPKTGYSVDWSDLWSASDKEKAEIGKIRAGAIKEYASVPTASSIVPESSFMRLCLGLSDDDIRLVEEEKEKMMKEEGAEVEPEQPPEGGPGGAVEKPEKEEKPEEK